MSSSRQSETQMSLLFSVNWFYLCYWAGDWNLLGSVFALLNSH